LYERGLYKDKMQGRQTQRTKDSHFAKNTEEKILDPSLDAHAILSACPDFAFEMTALQKLVEDRGHILLPSVVCHPEFAGGGIEYCWGRLKYTQRKDNDGRVKCEGGQKFIQRIKELCVNSEVLPMSVVWKFQRRARDYLRLYMSSSIRQGDDMLTYDSIESQRRQAKSHRCVGEGLERNFCIND
jgi:hypothetical protein